MKVLIINSVCGGGSTGRICRDLAGMVRSHGGEAVIAFGRNGDVPPEARSFVRRIGSDWAVRRHGLRTRLLDGHGFGSRRETEAFVAWMKEYDPDVIHLHNLHGYYVHIGVLFRALAELNKPIVWTLHDCWAFTGHCVHYDRARCGRWKTGCSRCPQKGTYPASRLLDRSAENYERKRQLFTLPENMTIVTPSRWLAGEVRQSFLGKYPVEVIGNGVDTRLFCPGRSPFTIPGQRIALGVANVWDERKGMDRLLELARRLDERWVVVLIGLTDRQLRRLPDRVRGIPRTGDPKALADWYRAADVLVNASAEETMGMTMAEAICCGTPVVAFDTTAIAETVGISGILVPWGDCGALAAAVEQAGAMGKGAFSYETERFEARKQYLAYWRLYERMKERER